MNYNLFILISSSIALAFGSLLASYFLSVKRERKYSDTLLGLLLIAIIARVLKSVLYYIFPDLSIYGVTMGFMGYALIGPIAYFYYNNTLSKVDFSLKNTLLHVVPISIGALFIIFNPDMAWYAYLCAGISFGVYNTYVTIVYSKHKKENKSKWHSALLFVLWLFFIVFALQLLANTMVMYTWGILGSCFLLYILFVCTFRFSGVLKSKQSKQVSTELLVLIEKAFEKDMLYKQPALTVSQLSEALETPVYLVSKAIKQLYGKTFPEAVNYFRIQEIKRKLTEESLKDVKIEHLAYDVGFNTSSAFYNAFKKETAMSPRAYQKMIQIDVV